MPQPWSPTPVDDGSHPVDLVPLWLLVGSGEVGRNRKEVVPDLILRIASG